MSVLESIPSKAEKLKEQLDVDATIIACVKDNQLGVGFSGVRKNKILLSLGLLSFAKMSEMPRDFDEVAYNSLLTPEVISLISKRVEKVAENKLLEKFD